MLNSEILDYIREQRLCVLAVEMLDGSPHAALVHFAHQENPLIFVIQTNPNSRKAELISVGREARVSLVIGLEEVPNGKDKTLQIDGVAKLVQSDEVLSRIYLDKFAENTGQWDDHIYLSVKPVRWRYTAWNGPGKKPLIIENA